MMIWILFLVIAIQLAIVLVLCVKYDKIKRYNQFLFQQILHQNDRLEIVLVHVDVLRDRIMSDDTIQPRYLWNKGWRHNLDYILHRLKSMELIETNKPI